MALAPFFVSTSLGLWASVIPVTSRSCMAESESLGTILFCQGLKVPLQPLSGHGIVSCCSSGFRCRKKKLALRNFNRHHHNHVRRFPCFNNIPFDFAMKPANPRKLGLLKLIFIYARSAAHCTIDFGTAYSLEAFRIDKSQR